jgi:glycosyltransferase involved in cell wall biosynthesis
VRVLFVVQRYGEEVAGGAERHCREFATRLAARGHNVEVMTTCAVGYMDWANHYPPGESHLDGVLVHRMPVAEERDWRFFGQLDRRVTWGTKPLPLHLQVEWMRRQGPYVPEMGPWLGEHGGAFDVVVFFTYLYFTTWIGLPYASAVAPTVLHPTAHREPALDLPLFDQVFRLPSALALSTPEEAAIVQSRFGLRTPQRVIGIGIDLAEAAADDGAAARAALGLDDRPYLLYVGRVDTNKAADELYAYFAAYKERNPGPLRLAMVGEQVLDLPPHPDVVLTGFVDDDARRAALSGALALVHPSYFESFAMVVTEAWAAGRPVLVNGRSEVLNGQVRRGGGGLPYHGFAEFEAAVDLLLEAPDAVEAMGRRGRAYTERHYTWDRVLGRYEHFLGQVASRRLASTAPPPLAS